MILIEIIIALAAFYFLLSILASGINEAFALLLNKRGLELKRSIKLLFAPFNENLIRDFYQHPLVSTLAERPKKDSIRGGVLKIINAFRNDKFEHRFPPSYIDSETFAQAFADVLIGSTPANDHTGSQDLAHLQSLYASLDVLDYTNYTSFQTTFLSPIDNAASVQKVAKEGFVYPETNFILQDDASKIWSEIDGAQSEEEFKRCKAECKQMLQEKIEQQKLFGREDEVCFQQLRSRFLIKNAQHHPEIYDLLSMQSNNMQEWKQQAADWYEQYMNRVSGWYKKRSHTNIFWFSVAIVLCFNLDTIAISQALYSSEQLRQSYLAIADAGITPESNLDIILDQLEPFMHFQLPGAGFWKQLPGYLMTIFAMALGAPFWFDFLNRFGNLRASGNKPEG